MSAPLLTIVARIKAKSGMEERMRQVFKAYEETLARWMGFLGDFR